MNKKILIISFVLGLFMLGIVNALPLTFDELNVRNSFLNKSEWISTANEYSGEYASVYAIDEDFSTFWLSNGGVPTTYKIDLTNTQNINCSFIAYKDDRQAYFMEVYYSNDNENWTLVTATNSDDFYTWTNPTTEQNMIAENISYSFENITTRYILFNFLNSSDNYIEITDIELCNATANETEEVPEEEILYQYFSILGLSPLDNQTFNTIETIYFSWNIQLYENQSGKKPAYCSLFVNNTDTIIFSDLHYEEFTDDGIFEYHLSTDELPNDYYIWHIECFDLTNDEFINQTHEENLFFTINLTETELPIITGETTLDSWYRFISNDAFIWLIIIFLLAIGVYSYFNKQ